MVSCQVWLNEGLASYFSNDGLVAGGTVADPMIPEMRFLLDEARGVMEDDVFSNSWPLNLNVDTPAQFEASFNSFA